MKLLLLSTILLVITGCVTTPTLKKDIKSSEIKYEGLEYKLNYQSLLKCWDDNAKKISVDGNNATYIQIYPELNMAEIYTRWSSGMYYSILFELIKIDKQKTLVNAYGTGLDGKEKIPEWIEVLKNCENQ